jgi:hypothetical protein
LRRTWPRPNFSSPQTIGSGLMIWRGKGSGRRGDLVLASRRNKSPEFANARRVHQRPRRARSPDNPQSAIRSSIEHPVSSIKHLEWSEWDERHRGKVTRVGASERGQRMSFNPGSVQTSRH